ncbi:hypothetical protein KMZ32_06150 [Phycicoccus sp. MAQZ13P-2]|uniref:hypothetical protein n=1 Tax=Phycicoccus mangrovi TaxID=2840470 RepID=UPI001C004A5E|nr:hypothetical protein [Phycicoccus mangrovi]MBT9257708.1 hypothetical protein [Phycicoccus mangrovi]MBT9273654.1 hypothetical protein [Phycicoccus mangrovi]
MTLEPARLASGSEVMMVTTDEDLAQLVRDARDEGAAVADLGAAAARLQRAWAAQRQLAALPGEQLREVLRLQRGTGQGVS